MSPKKVGQQWWKNLRRQLYVAKQNTGCLLYQSSQAMAGNGCSFSTSEIWEEAIQLLNIKKRPKQMWQLTSPSRSKFCHELLDKVWERSSSKSLIAGGIATHWISSGTCFTHCISDLKLVHMNRQPAKDFGQVRVNGTSTQKLFIKKWVILDILRIRPPKEKC